MAPTQKLEDAPIVVFGSEGGVHIVAEDIRGMLEILATDAEVAVDWDSIYYYADEEDEGSEYHAEYIQWVKEILGTSLRHADQVVEAAHKKLQSRLVEWMKPFLEKDVADSLVVEMKD